MYPSNPRHVAQVLRGIREAEDIYMTDPTGTAGMMVSHTDGKQEPFDPDKLLASIQKAGGDCLSDDVLSGIADEVTSVVKSKGGVDASALRGMVSERLTAASQKAGDAYNKGKAEPIKASEATEFSYRTASGCFAVLTRFPLSPRQFAAEIAPTGGPARARGDID